MGDIYKPQKGDRVRVVLEGEVESVTPGYGVYLQTNDYRSFGRFEHVVSIEKIDPPVETFGPGDVVRDRHCPEHVYAIADNGGYYSLFGKKFWDSGDPFTSDFYERVTLS